MPDIALFPYLILDARVRVGPWELVPRHLLTQEDATTAETFDAARKHLALYKLPTDQDSTIRHCGCFAKPPGGMIGDSFDRAGLPALRLALLAALLDQNPSRDANLPIAAQRISTSDNALLFGHPISEDGHVAIEYGVMVRTLLGGIRAGEDKGAIYHPAELHLPLFGCCVDGEYADVLYGLLDQNSDRARRLMSAIEWLDIAWRNTTSISQNVRVLALRSGFEALLNVGESVELGRAALSVLLDPAGVAKSSHTYTTRKGKPRAITVSDLEWWYTSFVFLRNKIAHGEAVAELDFLFNGRHQVHTADELLRQALKKTVVNATGRPDLLKSPSDRARRRAVAEAMEKLEKAGDQGQN